MEGKAKDALLVVVSVRRLHQGGHVQKDGTGREVVSGGGVEDANDTDLLGDVHVAVVVGRRFQSDWVAEVAFDGQEAVAIVRVLGSGVPIAAGVRSLDERLVGEGIGEAVGRLGVLPLIAEEPVVVAAAQGIRWEIEVVEEAVALGLERRAEVGAEPWQSSGLLVPLQGPVHLPGEGEALRAEQLPEVAQAVARYPISSSVVLAFNVSLLVAGAAGHFSKVAETLAVVSPTERRPAVAAPW